MAALLATNPDHQLFSGLLSTGQHDVNKNEAVDLFHRDAKAGAVCNLSNKKLSEMTRSKSPEIGTRSLASVSESG